jgi:hypothetical protein
MESSSSSMSFVSDAASPDAKIAPIVIAGAAFVGKAVAGGVIGGAATWGVNRVLDNRFPVKKN